MQPKRDQEFFWEGIDQGRLLAQACCGCGALRHPPRPMCPRCQSMAWEPRALSGRGRVYSWIVSTHPTQPDAPTRTVVLADMEEGLRLIANLVDGETVNIGDPVRITFGERDGVRLPFFTRKAAAA